MLDSQFDQAGVSHPNLSKNLNMWSYKERIRAMDETLSHLKIKDWRATSVLNIGSGTGVWEDYFSKKGVRELIGLDISKKSVNSLSNKFRSYKFIHLDASSKEFQSLMRNNFDIVIVADVLLHIVDIDKFERAMSNILHSAKKSGVVVIIDPVVIRAGFLSRFLIYRQGDTSRARELSSYRKLFSESGFRLRRIKPVTVFLNSPIEGRSDFEFRAFNRIWRMISMIDHKNEVIGWITGASLYFIDMLLLKMSNLGPSSKIMLLQRGSN